MPSTDPSGEGCQSCGLKILGEVSSYDALHELIRAQAEKLRLSRTAIDLLAKLQPGYASKLLAPKPIKRLGVETFEFVLPALGMKLVAVEDEGCLAVIAARGMNRNESQVRWQSDVVSFSLTRRFFQKNGQKGGANSRKYLDPERVVELARKAGIAGARARWGASRTRARQQPVPSSKPAGK